MATKSIITRIEGRVDQLIEDHKRLTQLCRDLTSERDELLGEKRELQLEVKRLNHEVSIHQLCEGLASNSASRDRARARVNRLMREVDKCINLLSASQEIDEL